MGYLPVSTAYTLQLAAITASLSSIYCWKGQQGEQNMGTYRVGLPSGSGNLSNRSSHPQARLSCVDLGVFFGGELLWAEGCFCADRKWVTKSPFLRSARPTLRTSSSDSSSSPKITSHTPAALQHLISEQYTTSSAVERGVASGLSRGRLQRGWCDLAPSGLESMCTQALAVSRSLSGYAWGALASPTKKIQNKETKFEKLSWRQAHFKIAISIFSLCWEEILLLLGGLDIYGREHLEE